MEELAGRYQQLLQAYKRLDYMTKKYVQLSKSTTKSSQDEEDELITHRDAVIKRFEFCYELTWKFFKLLLNKNFSIDVASPRKVFQECYQQAVFTREETELLLEMIDARNETTHVYDESVAEDISKKVVDYYAFLAQIVKKVAPDKL